MYRTCNGGLPGSEGCEGHDEEARLCNTDECEEEWSECSVSCGGGVQMQFKNRELLSQGCNLQKCPQWTMWSPWGRCTRTCGGGMSTKTRVCENGEIGDAGCTGDSKMSRPCSENSCASWTAWGAWDTCSKSCGSGGYQSSSRICQGKADAGVGSGCDGDSTRKQECNTDIKCKVTTPWLKCTVSCGGGGTRSRVFEDELEVEACGDTPCPEWGAWGNWTACSKTCGPDSVQTADRECKNGNVDDGGCVGLATRLRKCSMESCAVWDDWKVSRECSKSCGTGVTLLTRDCLHGEAGEGACIGSTFETIACNEQVCPSWSEWKGTKCSEQLCTSGLAKQTRECLNGRVGDAGCTGTSVNYEFCKTKCPEWGSWGSYDDCDAECGTGVRTRTRECIGGKVGEGKCVGDATQKTSCVKQKCHPCDDLVDYYTSCLYYYRTVGCYSYGSFMKRNCALTCCQQEMRQQIMYDHHYY